LKCLINPDYTHIGVGFATLKGKIKVVELLGTRPLMVNHLTESEDQGIEIRGIVLNPKVGLYAARVVSTKNFKKDLKVVGPPNIEFNKDTYEFIIKMEGPIDGFFYCGEDPKVLELYHRTAQVDKIPYGQPSADRVKVADLITSIRLPMEYLPDPRTVIEDA
jgi:hypothetical protein